MEMNAKRKIKQGMDGGSAEDQVCDSGEGESQVRTWGRRIQVDAASAKVLRLKSVC